MILLWLKIIGYKIIKALRPRTHADPGEQTAVPRVHVGIDPSTPTNRDAGVHVGVSLPPGIVPGSHLADLYTARMDAWEADREAREIRARLTHDPRECPCAGRHYPSASACRWCRCHDPENLHHTEARGIMQVIKPLAEDQERIAADGRRAFESFLDDAAHQLFGPIGPDVPDKLLAAGANPAQVEALRLALTGKRDPVTESSVRPAKEIVVCGACGHPDHTPGDGRCAFQVASRMQDGGFSVCPCGRDGDS